MKKLTENDPETRSADILAENENQWNPDRDNLSKTLLDHQEHILHGRTEADILYELLLKLGLDLCVPIERRAIAGKDVHVIGGGVLMWRRVSSSGTRPSPRRATPPASSATAPLLTTLPKPISPPSFSRMAWEWLGAYERFKRKRKK